MGRDVINNVNLTDSCHGCNTSGTLTQTSISLSHRSHYDYCLCNPVSYYDPDGKKPLSKEEEKALRDLYEAIKALFKKLQKGFNINDCECRKALANLAKSLSVTGYWKYVGGKWTHVDGNCKKFFGSLGKRTKPSGEACFGCLQDHKIVIDKCLKRPPVGWKQQMEIWAGLCGGLK